MDKQTLIKFLNSRIGKLYKILPLYEASQENAKVYIKSLKRELMGSTHTFEELAENVDFLSLINILNYLAYEQEDYSCYELRSEVFKSISLLNSIIDSIKE